MDPSNTGFTYEHPIIVNAIRRDTFFLLSVIGLT
jgi:hypothetical protein